MMTKKLLQILLMTCLVFLFPQITFSSCLPKIKHPNLYLKTDLKPLLKESILELFLDEKEKQLEGFLDLALLDHSDPSTIWANCGHGKILLPKPNDSTMLIPKPIDSTMLLPTPIFLNDELKYVPLVFQKSYYPSGVPDNILGCVKIPDFNHLINFSYNSIIEGIQVNSFSMFPELISSRDHYFFVKKHLSSSFSEEEIRNNKKRCRVVLTGKFTKNSPLAKPEIFFQVSGMTKLKNSFSNMQAEINFDIIRDRARVRIIDEEEELCSNAVTKIWLNKKQYRFWNTEFDPEAVNLAAERNLQCSLSVATSERNKQDLKEFICECANQWKISGKKSFAVWRGQFVKTCNERKEKFRFDCGD